jgi:hypothetical protein
MESVLPWAGIIVFGLVAGWLGYYLGAGSVCENMGGKLLLQTFTCGW